MIQTQQKFDTKGVVMVPQLNVEPSTYIIPLLHLLIAMVNKAWVCLVFFFDKFVENITKLEMEIKDDTQECKSFIANIESELEMLIVNKNMAYLEMVDNSSEKPLLKPLIDGINKKIKEHTKIKIEKLAELKKHKSELLIQKNEEW